MKNSQGGLELTTKEITRQYRLNRWIEIIKECRSSGQKISEWCAEKDISTASYYYWLKLVRTAACESLPALNSGNQQIVPVKMPTSPAVAKPKPKPVQHDSISHIILRVGSVALELHNGAGTDLIENTLRALANVR